MTLPAEFITEGEALGIPADLQHHIHDEWLRVRAAHGIVECDGGDGPCDNASLYRTECDLTPLLYEPVTYPQQGDGPRPVRSGQ